MAAVNAILRRVSINGLQKVEHHSPFVDNHHPFIRRGERTDRLTIPPPREIRRGPVARVSLEPGISRRQWRSI